MYALAHPLAMDKPFVMWKQKITTGMYLVMSPIRASTLSLVLILSTGRVSPQFHVSSNNSFATIDERDVNLVPPRYCQAVFGFIKGNKLVSVNSDQHDPSSKFISTSDQGFTTSEIFPEPE